MDDNEEGHGWLINIVPKIMERLATLEARLGPIQMIVYGLVAIVMTSVVVALISLVLTAHRS